MDETPPRADDDGDRSKAERRASADALLRIRARSLATTRYARSVRSGSLARAAASFLVLACACSSHAERNARRRSTPHAKPSASAAAAAGTAGAAKDPIDALDFAWIRQREVAIVRELVAALPAGEQARAGGIMVAGDDAPGDVNAYAGCTDRGAPFVVATDALLEIMAYSARANATDEIFHTEKLAAYTKLVAEQASPDRVLPRPPAAFFDPSQDADARKLAREDALFDAELAFVLGHELGHHYLGHTGCAHGDAHAGITLGDVDRLLSTRIAPGFNQLNEVAADTAGTFNAMTIGSQRPDRKFDEVGALIVLGFFSALDEGQGGKSLLELIEATHPPPSVRIPVVREAASAWHLTGGHLPELPSL